MKSLASPDQPAAQVVALAAQPLAAGQPTLTLDQARAFAQPLLAPQTLDSGENALAHADGMAIILRDMGGDEGLQACAYLVYASDHLQRPQETLTKAFGPDYARLAQSVTQLNHLQRQARASDQAYGAAGSRSRHENIRRMLLAFSRDLRVVLLRLSSRLQTLRWYAASRQPVRPSCSRAAAVRWSRCAMVARVCHQMTWPWPSSRASSMSATAVYAGSAPALGWLWWVGCQRVWALWRAPEWPLRVALPSSWIFRRCSSPP